MRCGRAALRYDRRVLRAWHNACAHVARSIDNCGAGYCACALHGCDVAAGCGHDLDVHGFRHRRILQGCAGNTPRDTPARRARRPFGGSCGGRATICAWRRSHRFLERTRSGDWSISAWAEGTFRIARDPQTRRETITQDSSGMAVFDAATRTFRSEGIVRMPLNEFLTTLGAAMTNGGGR